MMNHTNTVDNIKLLTKIHNANIIGNIGHFISNVLCSIRGGLKCFQVDRRDVFCVLSDKSYLDAGSATRIENFFTPETFIRIWINPVMIKVFKLFQFISLKVVFNFPHQSRTIRI